jgi:hypothetical protein
MVSFIGCLDGLRLGAMPDGVKVKTGVSGVEWRLESVGWV